MSDFGVREPRDDWVVGETGPSRTYPGRQGTLRTGRFWAAVSRLAYRLWSSLRRLDNARPSAWTYVLMHDLIEGTMAFLLR